MGFKEVYNLEGGIRAWQGLKTTGPTEEGMFFIREDGKPTEVILLAYGMEQGLGEFYFTMAKKASDEKVKGLFTKLGNIEEGHKRRLFDLYKSMAASVLDLETFKTKIVSKVMEGGHTTEEFLGQNQKALETVPEVLSVAMMIETQSLDLYLRYSQKIIDKEAKTLFFSLAEEEKTHLAFLGEFIDTMGK